jgi:hypothetical protein
VEWIFAALRRRFFARRPANPGMKIFERPSGLEV